MSRFHIKSNGKGKAFNRGASSEDGLTAVAESPSAAASVAAVAERPRSVPTHQEIAARARAIWQARGHQAGKDLDYWLEAEAQLRSSRNV